MISNVVPSSRVSSAGLAKSGENAKKKLRSPEKTSATPVNPWAASNAALVAFGHCQCSGHDGGARMRHRSGMRIIGLVSMPEDSVRQCGVNGRRDDARAQHACLFRAAERLDVANCALPRHQARARNHGSERIEQMQLSSFLDILGQSFTQCTRDIAA